jgi:hypothetical protein
VITDKLEAQIVALRWRRPCWSTISPISQPPSPGSIQAPPRWRFSQSRTSSSSPSNALQAEFPRQLGEGLCAEELLGHITRVLDGAVALARERMQTGGETP